MPWYYGVLAQEELGAAMNSEGAFFGIASMGSIPPLTGVEVKNAIEAGPQATPIIIPMYIAGSDG